ncbi:hypothetical protein HII31_02918 [Pseudocercospora fuligena]|uniref:Uncharacterized protein n=1 Tax=Pseudocercospora fuligena TaxID=685502 RepID=A0A8H6RR19_9PEZI|nr:hypothetical protein HII31_02918 [Pseudocercospora fuligena]
MPRAYPNGVSYGYRVVKRGCAKRASADAECPTYVKQILLSGELSLSSKATELVKFCSKQRDSVDAFSPGTNTDLKTVCGAHVIVSVNQKTPDSASLDVLKDLQKARKTLHELTQLENRFSLPCGHCGQTSPQSSRGGSTVVRQAENDRRGTKDDAPAAQ